jgi:ubiquinol-cytochrome c reductase cytochrome c subunit
VRIPVNRRVRNFAIVFAAFMVPGTLFLAFGSGPAQAGDASLSVALQTQLADTGQQLYEEHCASCHGEGAVGTSIAPPIIGLGPANWDFQMSTGYMPLANPKSQPIRKPPVLSPAEIQAVIAYLESLQPGGTPIPEVNPGAGNLSEGERIFQLNCAPCHSTSGNGGAVGPQVAPNLHQATPKQIGEAVRIGPGTMPVFNENVITPQQLDSLVAYVLTLRDPQHPGGFALGYGGPIVEGFVAILIGLGALVLVTRFIGERS